MHGPVRSRSTTSADNDAERRKVLDWTTSGNVTINGTIFHVGQDDLPFGGVGESGMGQYHGLEGFRTLSHAKGIYVQGRWNSITMLRAPFGRRTGCSTSSSDERLVGIRRPRSPPPNRNGSELMTTNSTAAP